MGDTGALAIGAGAGLPRPHDATPQLLLPIVGGLYVIETLSVIVQVGSFRLFQPAGVPHGARSTTTSSSAGWPETTVIIRFWILAGLCTALALGLFYADFISTRRSSD